MIPDIQKSTGNRQKRSHRGQRSLHWENRWNLSPPPRSHVVWKILWSTILVWTWHNHSNQKIQFGKKKALYIPERLRPFADFQIEAEGFVLKNDGSNSIAAVQHHNGSTQPYLAPNSSPKALLWNNKWIQAQLINQPEQKKGELIRAVWRKARKLINDQQTEDLLINLIDASQRPYILELNHNLFINQDLDVNLFTSEERQFWTSFDPQERNTLLTGNHLVCPEYRTQLCRFASPATPAPTAPAAPRAPSGSGSLTASGVLLTAPIPSTDQPPTSTAATTAPTYEPSSSTTKPRKTVFDKVASKAMKMST